MQRLRIGLLFCALLGLAACGEQGSEDQEAAKATAAPALEGAAWDGDPVDPTQKGDKVRVISFFKPG